MIVHARSRSASFFFLSSSSSFSFSALLCVGFSAPASFLPPFFPWIVGAYFQFPPTPLSRALFLSPLQDAIEGLLSGSWSWHLLAIIIGFSKEICMQEGRGLRASEVQSWCRVSAPIISHSIPYIDQGQGRFFQFNEQVLMPPE